MPAAVFDQVTRLVGRDRPWFKSRVGLDVRETPREQATSAADLIKMADQRMNEARQAGRGRVFPAG